MWRGHLLQMAGLVVGFLPAVVVLWGFNTGAPVFAAARLGIGFVWPWTRSFAYGALCSFLIFPGLALVMLVT
ncbi:MAG: hypothetical protein U0R77_11720 [Mycolicibacterium insubricum]